MLALASRSLTAQPAFAWVRAPQHWPTLASAEPGGSRAGEEDEPVQQSHCPLGAVREGPIKRSLRHPDIEAVLLSDVGDQRLGAGVNDLPGCRDQDVAHGDQRTGFYLTDDREDLEPSSAQQRCTACNG